MTTRPHIDEARVICACQHSAPASAPTLHRLAARVSAALPLALSLCLAITSLGFATVPAGMPGAGIDGVRQSVELSTEPFGPSAELRTLDHVVTLDELELARHAYFSRYVPYGEMIYTEAKRNGLEPELVAAIVRAESNFRPVAVSERSATGLMQVVPSTGRELGAADLTDPRTNIETGTRYLRYLSNQYRGNVALTLAAYNAGEGAVRRYDGVPPYRETQQYVQRVGVYRRGFRQAVAHLAVHGEAPKGHPAQR